MELAQQEEETARSPPRVTFATSKANGVLRHKN
jgi:hypothetical protein